MVTTGSLKETQAKLGHIWFDDQPNIIGVRTTLDVPDVFNDLIFIVYKQDGVEKLFSATITTDPGVYYQKKLLNPKGCAVMKPGQYINCYQLGFHKGDKTHRALVQVGKMIVCRDNDLDGKAETEGFLEDNGYHGCNIHGGKKLTDLTEVVGQHSAGCQVHSRWSKKEEMCDIAQLYEKVNNGLLSYTLILEKDLCQE